MQFQVYLLFFRVLYVISIYIPTSWRFYNTMVIPITQPSQRAGVAATTRQNFSRCSSCGDVQKNVRLSYANCEFMWIYPVKIGFLNIKHTVLSNHLSLSPHRHLTIKDRDFKHIYQVGGMHIQVEVTHESSKSHMLFATPPAIAGPNGRT